MKFEPNCDVWLVWTTGLKAPSPYLGASSPGKPLFQTRSEKLRSLALHLLKEEERNLPLDELVKRYPAPASPAS